MNTKIEKGKKLEQMIVIENAKKQYKDTIVFPNINVSFEKGKAYGILGRNGSGRTVLFL